jgi:hypothetical protein
MVGWHKKSALARKCLVAGGKPWLDFDWRDTYEIVWLLKERDKPQKTFDTCLVMFTVTAVQYIDHTQRAIVY